MSERIQEIVKSLHICSSGQRCHPDCVFVGSLKRREDCQNILMEEAAGIIESLQRETDPVPLTDEELKPFLHKHVWVKNRDSGVMAAVLGFDATLCQYVAYCGERGVYWKNDLTGIEIYATEPKGEATT